MITHKSYKFRLKPTELQEQLLLQHTGNTRFLHNKLVEFSKDEQSENNKFPTDGRLKKEIISIKNQNDFLKLTYSQPLQMVATRIFRTNQKSIKKETIAKRKQKIAIAQTKPVKSEEFRQKAIKKAKMYGFPNFKKKSDMNGNLFFPQHFKIKRSRIEFPKLGWIDYIRHRKIEGTPKNLAITQDGDLWFVSICCEIEIKEKVKPYIDNANIVGIDLGIKDFATLSDGSVIKNPRIYDKCKKKLAKEQKKLSRKQYVEKEVHGKKMKVSSNNREKQRLKVRKVNRKIKNTRKDFLHKTTHDMITKYDGFILESLSIQEMLQKNGTSQNRNTCDVSWFQFVLMLEYKSKWNSKYFHKVGKYFPSTKTCSKCGNIQEMPVEIRTYHCQACGMTMDRDLNSAYNLVKEGIPCLKQILKDLEDLNEINTTSATGESYACGQSSLENWAKQEKRDLVQALA